MTRRGDPPQVMSDPPLTLGDLAAMDVGILAGVGDAKIASLRSLGIESLLDLVQHFPRRYIDRSDPTRVRDLRAGEDALVLATLRKVDSRRTRSRRTMVIAEFSDGTGSLRATFFNQPWRARQLERLEGVEVALYGRTEVFRGSKQMTNPLVDPVGDQTGRIVSVYPLTEKSRLTSSELAAWVAQVFRRAARRGILDPVPQEILRRHGLIGRSDALSGIHFPGSTAEMAASRRRLVFDELLRIQISLVDRKREMERSSRGIRHRPDAPGARPGDVVAKFHEGLPYELTGAQRRAVTEICDDLASPVPMHRLLQGDVGSGKTLVALIALLHAVQSGHQGALMAPTEVLAEQHARSLRSLLAGLMIPDPGSLLGERQVAVGLLTGTTRAPERRRLLADLAAGTIDMLVGTHALLEETVSFASLGLVVIDEQHRFGVEQRAALRATDEDDGIHPDVLVMTATPIPRTAAMTVYGDLDVTVLDELPPGRTPVETTWAHDPDAVSRAWFVVREQVADGRQAYVVCPLVEGSDKIEAASAEQTLEELDTGELAGLRLGLLHGRMTSDEKDSVMSEFRAGRIDVLVATTVIEVGVDVPNATVMVILDADRFGLAQLHQLRGRVGRGSARSFCILVSGDDPSPDGVARLEAMVATTDGFELAEVDLELRGEGTIMGHRQKGRSDLRLASLRRDAAWVSKAREVAFELIDDPAHAGAGAALLAEADAVMGAEAEYLDKS